MLASMTSACVLNGNACHWMSPRRIAASNAARASGVGQRKAMPVGQSRYSETSQALVVYTIRSSPMARISSATCSAAGKNSLK